MESSELQFAKVLADETRQEIMRHLCCQWLSVSEVVEELGGRVNQPTVSHHLRMLERAGLVKVRRQGRQRFYTLDQARVALCCGRLMARFAPEYSSHEERNGEGAAR